MLFSGCETVQETIYLRSVDVSGPVSQPPLHLVTDNTERNVCFSPHASFRQRATMEGDLVTDIPAEYATTGKTLRWDMTDASFGGDFDFRLSKSVALTVGLNYAAGGGETYWGGTAGLGFLFHGDHASSRLELGVQFQSIQYDAMTVVVKTVTPLFSSPTTSVDFFHDIGRSEPFGFYGSLTVNSHNENWPINLFGQIAFVKQGLTTFTPHTEYEGIGIPPFIFPTHITTDTRTGTSVVLFHFTPGFYLNVGSNVRFLAGVRLTDEISIENNSVGFIAAPVMQFDIGL
jgi:hypothetical protein